MRIAVNDHRVDITVVEDDGTEAPSLTTLAVAEVDINSQNRGLWLRRLVRRVCLATHLRSDPAMLAFGREAAGRPFLLGHDTVGFSLAQAGGLTIIAIRDGPVGIDIELPMRLPGRAAWSPFLSDAEAAAVAVLPEAAARALALKLWVRKEALFKAVGTGFLIDPRTVTLLDRDGAWGVRLQDVSIGDGAVCAAAVVGMSEIAISCRRVPLSKLAIVADVFR